MQCSELADSTEELMKSSCSVIQQTVAKPPQPPASLSSGAVAKEPAEPCAGIDSSLEANDMLRQAEEELKKLQVLKQLEEERLELQRLMAAAASEKVSF